MTVMDAANKLFEWFADNDSFSVEEDFQKIILISECKERDLCSVALALEQLQESALVKKHGDYWILTRPFQQWEQSVSLNGPVSSGVAETVNDFCDLIEDQTDRCDASSVREKDIRNMLIIAEHYKSLWSATISGDDAEG